jgi:hypothetical protein
MNWFFDQFVKSPMTVDYEVSRITNRKRSAESGWYDSDTGRVFVKKPFDVFSPDSNTKYISSFTVLNNGDAYFPVQIFVRFENGDTTTIHWDGKDNIKKFTFERPSKLHTVIIDPNQHNRLDLEWTNNSRTIEPSSAGFNRYTVRFWFWIESVFQFFATLI